MVPTVMGWELLLPLFGFAAVGADKIGNEKWVFPWKLNVLLFFAFSAAFSFHLHGLRGWAKPFHNTNFGLL